MLDQDTRKVIYRLRVEGHGIRAIARALKISRNTVKSVLEKKDEGVPEISKPSGLEPHMAKIYELYVGCEGNLVRVHEELGADGVEVPYSTLTGFCRRFGIGVKPKKRTGRYEFGPGEEMQHDTSPHKVIVGGRKQLVQCASLVLCYSRMMYAQVYPTFNRFYCKTFLTEAFKELSGVAKRCMVDNTSVLIASGSGKNAKPAPEMQAFADRFGFVIEAHEIGDANRSARVEGPFHYIERNFYPGRTFDDLRDLNRQLAQWCKDKSHRFIRDLQAKPIDLYQTDRLHLAKLPIHVPEVYALHSRLVNLEGNVNLHTNAYSVPDEHLGKSVEVRETIDRVTIYLGHKLVAEHERAYEGARARVFKKEHRTPGRRPPKKNGTPVLPEENTLRAAAPALDALVTKFRNGNHAKPLSQIRKLYGFFLEYPTDALCQAVSRALEYGLTDLARIEKMVLQNVAGDFFRLELEKKTEAMDE